jgi:murein DD-endopeptidase MepM/ murein hydrolase activator NlpD
VIHRRAFLGTGAAAACLPLTAHAATPSRLTLTGTLEQGSLVIGRTTPDARVTVDGKRLNIAANGAFAFGFLYDQKEPVTLAATFADGTSETRSVAPVQRQYAVQAINGLPPQQAHPTDPDITARIKREHALVYAARSADTDIAAFAEPFDWPAHGIISGVFGSQRILNGTPGAPHFGVDVAAGEGGEIHAPTDCIVALVGQFFLEGGYTMLDHGHGVFTGYLHQSAQYVKQGDRLKRGQIIGHVGHTGRATGPHLHWAMNWFQVRLDPSRSTRTPTASKV